MIGRARLTPLVLAAALFSAGCDEDESLPLETRDNAFVWHGAVSAGQTVTVRDFRGDIDVKPSADDTVRVVARLEWRGTDTDKSVSLQGSTVPSGVLICATFDDGRCNEQDYSAKLNFRGGRSARVFFTVEVPAGVKLVLTNIDGDVTAVASAPVRANTMDGSIRVATSVGPVRAETLNGSVDIRMSSLVGTDSVVAKTLNGEAFIYLPSVDDAVIDLSVANGSMATAFPENQAIAISGRKFRATVGAGTRVIHGHVLNGEVALRKLDAEGKSH